MKVLILYLKTVFKKFFFSDLKRNENILKAIKLSWILGSVAPTPDG